MQRKCVLTNAVLLGSIPIAPTLLSLLNPFTTTVQQCNRCYVVHVKYEHYTGLTVWRSGHSVPEIPHAISMQTYSFDCLIQHAIYFRVTEKGDDGLVRRVLAPRRCRCISLLPITEENMAAANPFVLSLFSVVIMFSCKILFIVRMAFTNSCSCLR